MTCVLVVGSEGGALEGEGYEILGAETSDAAEDLLLARKPDLAVIDLVIEYPDSGLVLCHRLKQLYPGTPVIILNGVAAAGLDLAPHSAEEQAWIEAELVLAKPVLADSLRFEARRLLGGGNAARAVGDGG